MRTYGKPTSSVPVSVLVKRLINPFRKVLSEILAVFIKILVYCTKVLALN